MSLAIGELFWAGLGTEDEYHTSILHQMYASETFKLSIFSDHYADLSSVGTALIYYEGRSLRQNIEVWASIAKRFKFLKIRYASVEERPYLEY